MSPRRLIGAGIWVLGIVGLGIWASQTVAPSIEARLAAQSAAIVEGAVHGVTAQVDGRDVILSGIMDGTNERGRIMTALNSLPSVREIRDQSLVLPTIYPYDITAKRTVDGIQWKGHIPTEAARSRIGALIGSEAAAQLTLAAGGLASFADRDIFTVRQNGGSDRACVITNRAKRRRSVADNPARRIQRRDRDRDAGRRHAVFSCDKNEQRWCRMGDRQTACVDGCVGVGFGTWTARCRRHQNCADRQ
jgi:hypothetical protein